MRHELPSDHVVIHDNYVGIHFTYKAYDDDDSEDSYRDEWDSERNLKGRRKK